MRVCVKGFPKTTDEAHLRAHFQSLGELITDVKIVRTRAGASRQFGFIGFKTDEASVAAVRRFNKSFLGACRLLVETAAEIDDDTRTKLAWSRHTKHKVAAKAAASAALAAPSQKPASEKGAGGRQRDSERLREYVALAGVAVGKGPSWANDDALSRSVLPGGKAKRGRAAAAPVSDGGGSDSGGDSTDSGEYADAPGAGSGVGAAVARGVRGAPAAAAAGAVRAATAATAPARRGKESGPLVGGGPAAAATAGRAGEGPGTAELGGDDDSATPPPPPVSAGGRLPASDADFLRAHVVRGGFDSDDDDDGEEAGGKDEEGDEEDDDDAVSSVVSSDSDDDDDDEEEEDGEDVEAAVGTAAGGGAAASAGGEGRGGAMPARGQQAGGEAEEGAAEALAAEDEEAGGVEDADVGESGRLFVRNLPYTATDEELAAHFCRWGATAEVRVVRDARGRATGCAHVLFVLPEHAVAALAGADGRVFQGRLLHVLPARPPPRDRRAEAAAAAADAAGDGPKQSQFQREADAARRAAAGSAHEASSVWNSLFLRADTTVAAMAEQLGVGRGELLMGGDEEGGGKKKKDGGGSSSGGMAVRLALAETELIAQTRRFLADEGVDLGVLEGALAAAAAPAAAPAPLASRSRGGAAAATPAPAAAALPARSDRVILVKNLPFSSEAPVLRDLFSRHGLLARFVLPPTRAMALVEFVDPRQAKRAFASLAYTRYQRAPLFLEWAPEAVFSRQVAPPPAPAPPAAAAAASTASAAAAVPRGAAPAAAAPAAPAPAIAPADAAAAAEAGGGARTLFVKGVSFATSEEGLRGMFAPLGRIRAVRIPRRRNPKYRPLAAAATADAGAPAATAIAAAAAAAAGGSGALGVGGAPEFLSMGYGFVEYEEPAAAAAALRALQGRELDGHALQLKVSTAAAPAADSAAGGAEPGVPSVAAAAPAAAAKKKAKAAAAVAPDAPPPAAPVAADGGGGGGSKLLVRNLAFEATAADVRALFAGFGQVKSLRLPKKFDGSHRGFAFVDFLTRQEAAAAQAALAATHLYGRHLVVEWAQAEGGAADAGKGVGVGASGQGAARPAAPAPPVGAAAQAAGAKRLRAPEREGAATGGAPRPVDPSHAHKKARGVPA